MFQRWSTTTNSSSFHECRDLRLMFIIHRSRLHIPQSRRTSAGVLVAFLLLLLVGVESNPEPIGASLKLGIFNVQSAVHKASLLHDVIADHSHRSSLVACVTIIGNTSCSNARLCAHRFPGTASLPQRLYHRWRRGSRICRFLAGVRGASNFYHQFSWLSCDQGSNAAWSLEHRCCLPTSFFIEAFSFRRSVLRQARRPDWRTSCCAGSPHHLRWFQLSRRWRKRHRRSVLKHAYVTEFTSENE